VTRISWSPQSLRDLEGIRDYIAQDSPYYADLTLRRTFAAVERLAKFRSRAASCPNFAACTFVS
jgi:toxin ParE1/3/4